MSYAIIRNAKYKRENLMAVYRHDERKNKHYSNKDIDRTKSHLNKSSCFLYILRTKEDRKSDRNIKKRA